MDRPTPPPVPPPVPPAIPPRVPEPPLWPPIVARNDDGLPTILPSRRRRRGPTGSGIVGAGLSLMVAGAVAIAAVIAWPQLQSLTTRHHEATTRPSGPRQVAARHSIAPVATSTSAPIQQEAREKEAREKEAREKEARLRRERDELAQAADRRPPTPGPVQRPHPPVVDTVDQAPPHDISPEEARVAGEEVTRQLQAAATALRAHDHHATAGALDAAARAADGHTDLSSRVDRWGLLLDYARQLDGHVADAIASANEGREYSVGDRTISIVEIGPSSFVFKEAGQMRRGKKLPRVVERAILAAWFEGDPRPANHILLGVHRLLDDDADLARVRREWQTAAEDEPAARSIMPLLDDPVLAPVPRR
jgi:hypothetical protein